MGTTAEPVAAVLAVALAAGLLACAFTAGDQSPILRAGGGRIGSAAAGTLRRWRKIWIATARDGAAPAAESRNEFWFAGCVAGAFLGFSVLGTFAAVAGAIAGPFALRAALRARRNRFAGRIDGCAADFALALASALAGGNSVRGALALAGRATP